MNFRRLIDSIVSKNKPKADKKDSEQSLVVPIQDILRKKGYTYSYFPFGMDGAHSEEFDAALRIAKEFKQIIDYEPQLTFWEGNYSVFGLASVVVFDLDKKVYGGYHGYSHSNPIEGLEYTEGRYVVVNIFPRNINEFWSFIDWCTRQHKAAKCYKEGFTIMDQAYYWKQISQHKFPKNRLRELLAAAEAHCNSITTLPSPYGLGLMTIETAKKYFFFFGVRDATHGDVSIWGPSGSTATLFSVVYNLHTWPIVIYGEIFFQYADGYHSIEMVDFLEKQKERLEKGEDITLPGIDRASMNEQAREEKKQPSVSETKDSGYPDQGIGVQLKLSHPQIAILHHIAGWPITRNNADVIAQKYGQTSGQKLETTYNELTSRLVRTGKGKNRVKDYEEISLLIPDNCKALYNKELEDVRNNNKK